MNNFFNDMDNIFSSILGAGTFDSHCKIYNHLKTDIIELEHEYLLKIDMPGLNKENIKLTVLGNKVYLNVEVSPINKEGKYLIKERQDIVKLSEIYKLPQDVDSNNVYSEYRDGVLTIKLNKLGEDTRYGRPNIKIN